MAPEAFLDGLYSSSSDVWSFGVVVWEIFTDAVQPFFGLPNHQVISNILQVCDCDFKINTPCCYAESGDLILHFTYSRLYVYLIIIFYFLILIDPFGS